MPVKNTKRRTNDGLEGVITGLTEEEKKVLNKSGFVSSKDVEELTKVMPTDVAIKENKLGLEHDSTWLTNQNAITLGDGFTYDATTNTLNTAAGGGIFIRQYNEYKSDIFIIPVKSYEKNKVYKLVYDIYASNINVKKILAVSNISVGTSEGEYGMMVIDGVVFITQVRAYVWPNYVQLELYYTPLETVTITTSPKLQITTQFICEK